MQHEEALRRQRNANEAESKEGSHHGERGNLDVCIEKRYHSCLSILNCKVTRRFPILKKNATTKTGEERGRNQVKKEKHSTMFKDDEWKEEREQKIKLT